MYNRKRTRPVAIGNVVVGGGADILIQSMTNTKTSDVEATVAQIKELTDAGCEIVRVSAPDMPSALAIKAIKQSVSIPVVVDIHFDHRLALEAIKAGADKLRINPGNIGSRWKVAAVADAARERGVPIRIGVNGGSVEKALIVKYGGPTPEAIAESALNHAKILEECGFFDIVISVKSSSVQNTVKAYEILSEKTDYPLHVGITEAGTFYAGTVKSAVGIGAVLSRGIGDTIRVSLTEDPVKEVECAVEILKAMGIRRFGAEIISCPTCARTRTNLIALAKEVERRCAPIKAHITVAVMGCGVNGPGEAREADYGVAGGDGAGVIFKKGQIVGNVPEHELADALMNEIYRDIGRD